MEVFISWSGVRSKKIAEALHDWLPKVIQAVDPFMSAVDINQGSRWSSQIGSRLQRVRFGLICLTPENLKAPWLLFEAGALSKSLDDSRVVPYLYGITLAQLQGPLAQFQASEANKEQTFKMLKSINEASKGSGLDSARLEEAFEKWWPELKKRSITYLRLRRKLHQLGPTGRS